VYEQHLYGVAVDSANTNNYVYIYSTADAHTIEDNKWYHVAMVRNGNVFTLYLDGTAIDNETYNMTVNNASSIMGVGKQGVYNDGFWKGWISNFRLVMGTAVYTSNFTPSTSPLTAITNTKLLCCQDADPTVDNSGTSKTLTVTAANTYTQQLSPFDYDWYDDHSGQDNHYQADNITINSIMLDSPTNNYPTINAKTPYNYTMTTPSQGNLHVAATQYDGYYGNHIATFKVPESGKWYIETRMAVYNGTGNTSWIGVMPQRLAIIPKDGTGVVDGEYFTNSTFTGMTADLIATVDTIRLFNGGSAQATVSSATATSYIIALALDVDNNKVYGGYDSGSGITWLASGNPAAGSNGQSHTFTNDTIIQLEVGPKSDGTSNSMQTLNFGQNGTFSGYERPGGNADGNGEGNFFYAPPSGFKALCSKNLPTPAIKKPSDHFNTVLWTGNGSTQNITGVGFQPDWIWGKNRSDTNAHWINDAVRGVDKRLIPNSDAEEDDPSTAILTAFGSDGFSLGSNTEGNKSSDNYVAWCLKAGGSTSTNTDGSEDSTVSVNTTAGFSIADCVGAGPSTYGHGLGVTPKVVIQKSRDGGTSNWYLFTTAVDGSMDYFFLNTTATKTDNTTTLTSSTFSTSWNNGQKFIVYSFAEVEGFSKFASYEGNGSTAGPFINTGFKPAFLMVKNVDSTSNGNWRMYDNKRDPDNYVFTRLFPHATNAESTATSDAFDFYSNGFKVRGTGANINTNNNTYFYMAFAESPFKHATAR